MALRATHIPTHHNPYKMPTHDVYNDKPPLTVAEQIAADPSVKAIGTVISKLPSPKPEAEPKLVEVIERKAGNLTRRDF